MNFCRYQQPLSNSPSGSEYCNICSCEDSLALSANLKNTLANVAQLGTSFRRISCTLPEIRPSQLASPSATKCNRATCTIRWWHENEIYLSFTEDSPAHNTVLCRWAVSSGCAEFAFSKTVSPVRWQLTHSANTDSLPYWKLVALCFYLSCGSIWEYVAHAIDSSCWRTLRRNCCISSRSS